MRRRGGSKRFPLRAHRIDLDWGFGVDVLLQSLIGAKLTTPPKQGHWTNCAVLSIH